MRLLHNLPSNVRFEGRCRLAEIVGTALYCLTVTGCASPDVPPDLKPVSGTVRTAGGELITGGLIEFRHISDHLKRSTSNVDKQGRFSLSTADANNRFPGAYPGDYNVAVYRSISFDKLPVSKPVTIPAEGHENLEIVVGESAR